MSQNDDLISRQEAIDALKNRWKKTRNYEGIGDDIAEECELYLKQVPSAQPEHIRGRWIDTNIFFPNTCGQLVHEVYCDKCHGIAYFRRTNNAYVGASICPNWGADMRGEQE